MAGVQWNIEVRPDFDTIQRRINEANSEHVEEKRSRLRSLGRRFKELAQDEAPKRTGEFADTIFFRTYVSGNVVGFTAGGRQPLSDWIRFGTRPHPIVGNPLLAFFWERVGEFVIVHSVQHPGTKPNDYLQRAHDRWLPEARSELDALARTWVRKVSG